MSGEVVDVEGGRKRKALGDLLARNGRLLKKLQVLSRSRHTAEPAAEEKALIHEAYANLAAVCTSLSPKELLMVEQMPRLFGPMARSLGYLPSKEDLDIPILPLPEGIDPHKELSEICHDPRLSPGILVRRFQGHVQCAFVGHQPYVGQWLPPQIQKMVEQTGLLLKEGAAPVLIAAEEPIFPRPLPGVIPTSMAQVRPPSRHSSPAIQVPQAPTATTGARLPSPALPPEFRFPPHLNPQGTTPAKGAEVPGPGTPLLGPPVISSQAPAQGANLGLGGAGGMILRGPGAGSGTATSQPSAALQQGAPGATTTTPARTVEASQQPQALSVNSLHQLAHTVLNNRSLAALAQQESIRAAVNALTGPTAHSQVGVDPTQTLWALMGARSNPGVAELPPEMAPGQGPAAALASLLAAQKYAMAQVVPALPTTSQIPPFSQALALQLAVPDGAPQSQGGPMRTPHVPSVQPGGSLVVDVAPPQVTAGLVTNPPSLHQQEPGGMSTAAMISCQVLEPQRDQQPENQSIGSMPDLGDSRGGP